MSSITDKEKRVMSDAVLLHHEHRLTQAEVAERLGISKSRVSEILKRAHDLGYYRVVISAPINIGLASRLKVLFNEEVLHSQVRVVIGGAEEVRRAIGIAGARYFEEVLDDEYSVSIDYGLTIGDMVEAHQPTRRDIKLYPIASTLVDSPYGSIQAIIGGLYFKYGKFSGLIPHLLPSDGDIIKTNQILEESAKADIFLMGASGVDSPMFRENVKRLNIDWNKLKEHGVIGTCASTAFDRAGNVVESEFDVKIPKILGSRIKEVARQKGKHVILMAGGADKVEAIRALIKGGWMNVLITDQETAEEILKTIP